MDKKIKKNITKNILGLIRQLEITNHFIKNPEKGGTPPKDKKIIKILIEK